jgi:hypothetical protein
LAQRKAGASCKAEAHGSFAHEHEIRSDRQNTHDSAVNESLKATYGKIKTWNGAEKALLELRKHVDMLPEPKRAKAAKALRCLERENFYIIKLDARELDVLAAVWNRTVVPENRHCADNLKEAICEGLSDMVTDKEVNVVCPSGRVSRLIESLTCIDTDASLGGAVTLDMLRHEAIARSHEILQETIEQHRADHGSPFRRAAEVYASGADDIKLTEEEECAFKETIKGKVMVAIRDLTSSRISADDSQKIMKHCTDSIEYL